MHCLIDGHANSCIPADDRGLLYGDALFETIAFKGGKAPLWDWHWRRLHTSADQLGIPCPDQGLLLDEALRLAGQGAAIIRITLTRGSGGRAYWPDQHPEGRRILLRRDWPTDLNRQRSDGIRLIISQVALGLHPQLQGLKHGNRLEQVLAARECQAAGADEALLFDTKNHLAEAISSNLLLDIGGQLYTPTSGARVDGVGLAWLIDQTGDQIQQRIINRESLGQIGGIMVVNSVAGIRPAVTLDGQPLTISGHCRALQSLWNHHFERC